ncbi:MAG: hypothetical protein ACR2O0_11230 [Rhizobiaceae bacterium]
MSKLVAVAVAAILFSMAPVKLDAGNNSLTVKSSSAFAFSAIAETKFDELTNQKLNKRATTVLEVVINEMAGSGMVGTEAAFQDAINIASVIANRADSAGITQQAAVSIRREFNGFGRKMRPGAIRDFWLAKHAIEFVSKYGSQHKAMFYATPPCIKYLPRGLKSVARTAGHIFFVDPQRRSYKTADGYVRPDESFFTYYSSRLNLKTVGYFGLATG